MKAFTDLYNQLDETPKKELMEEAMVSYFSSASDNDKIWALALLCGRQPKRIVTHAKLLKLFESIPNLPPWILQETYNMVGDQNESIALLLPKPINPPDISLNSWMQFIGNLKNQKEEKQKQEIIAAWGQLKTDERYVFNKLITGGFRMSVGQLLLSAAISKVTGIDDKLIALRLMTDWKPDSITYQKLIVENHPADNYSLPFSFCLAQNISKEIREEISPNEWQVERFWDGIRAQLIVRNDELFIWSKTNELLTAKFPEFFSFAESLPNGTVIDGVILAHNGDYQLSLSLLKTRISRKTVSKKSLKEIPVIFMACDLLEMNNLDITNLQLSDRRKKLIEIITEKKLAAAMLMSEELPFEKIENLELEIRNARKYFSKGLILKRKNSLYRAGRELDNWVKWKVEPMLISAVLIYVQSSSGGGPTAIDEGTFAVWQGELLIPFAKIKLTLSEESLAEIIQFARKNTVERFGPVRSIKAEHVFKIAFDGIDRSARHKSGVTVQDARIVKWEKDKNPSEANSLIELKDMLNQYGEK